MMQSAKWQFLISKVVDWNWNRGNVWILMLFSGVLAIYLYGANIKAQWWLIDDHEIVYFLGSDGVLRVNEIWEKLIQDTEVGHIQLPRFRPVYYVIRLLECSIWGDNLSLWYGFRVFIYGFFVGSFWYLISRKTGCAIGGFLTLYVAVQTYWVDIFSRLGPSEVYAVFGLMVFGWGIYVVYTSNKATGWGFLFAGAVLCSGSKENFLILILPLLYIVWDLYKRGGLNFARAALAFGAFMWMIWIGFMVASTTLSYGGDVYGNSVGIRTKILTMVRIMVRVDVLVLLFFCLLLVYLYRSFRMKNPAFLENYQRDVSVVIVLSLIYISQIFFYNNNWPTGTRYNFPGMLVVPLVLAVFISIFKRVTQTDDYLRYRSSLVLVSFIVLAFLAFSQVDNISRILDFNKRVVDRTTRFSTKMSELAKLGIQHPDYVFILQTDSPNKDYEAVFSYYRFLRFYSAKNPVSLLWTGLKPEAYSETLQRSLVSDLQGLSFWGKFPATIMGNEHDFTSYSEVDGSETKCIMLLLSGELKRECQILVVEDWR